jgi:hypothetical protein
MMNSNPAAVKGSAAWHENNTGYVTFVTYIHLNREI